MADKLNTRHHDAYYYELNKLNELISDDTTSVNDAWIGRLIDNFLRNHGDGPYKVQDLPIVMQILEFLVQRSKNVEEHGIRLDRMLELCKLPPLLRKSGDGLRCTNVMEQYFTLLGYLIVVSSNERDVDKVIRAVDRLLEPTARDADTSAVKADLCLVAMETSRLPIIASQLVEISSVTIFGQILELVLLLVAKSNSCCCRMLEAGILDCLLIRMDLPYQYNAADENVLKDSDATLWIDCTIVGTNIAWVLLQSILSSSHDLEKVPAPNARATRSLRNILRRQVCESSRRASPKDIMLRNDLAAMILAGLAAFPSWRLSGSGLAYDLVVLSIATESGASGTWTECVKFRPNNEDDALFKKIMLSILCELCNRGEGAVSAIMTEQKIMTGILDLIDLPVPKFSSPVEYVMRILARLAPIDPEEFTLQKGPPRLVRMLVRWTSPTEKFDSHVVLELAKTMCNVITRKCCTTVIESFREAGIIDALVDLIDRILSFDRLTMEHQRILTIAIVTIEEMTKTKGRRSPVEKFISDWNVEIPMKLLERCFYQGKDDFQLDQRLLIAIGSYMWECIVSCIANTEKFVKRGGTYGLLDVIENASFPVRCVYLGILADACSIDYAVISQLCTWRGRDKSVGYESIFGKSWREEEIRTGVKRTVDGLIDDMEIPLMSQQHRAQVFRSRMSWKSSPAIDSFVGSVRPKIHAVGKIISSDANLYDRIKDRYKILSDSAKSEDRITMYIADQFYRLSQGQVWSEVSRCLEQRGVNLLGMDGEIIILMNERHCGWAMYVRGLQDGLVRANRKNETEREQNELTRIRNSKLGTSLNALERIDYVRRTTERDYAIRTKKIQRDQIENAFRSSRDFDDRHCHSCPNVGPNVAANIASAEIKNK